MMRRGFAFVIILTILIPSLGSSWTPAEKEGHRPTVLLTGFTSFGRYEINPSQLIVENLSGKVIDNAIIIGLILPVNWTDSYEITRKAIERYKPDVIICTGLAPRSCMIRVEEVALNLRWSRSFPFVEVISKCGPLFRFSNLPCREIIAKLREEGIPSRLSCFAGIYVCNYLFYRLLDYKSRSGLDIKAGFVHVPPPDRMEINVSKRAIETIISAAIHYSPD